MKKRKQRRLAGRPRKGSAAERAVRAHDSIVFKALQMDAEPDIDCALIAKRAKTSIPNVYAALDRWRPEWRE